MNKAYACKGCSIDMPPNMICKTCRDEGLTEESFEEADDSDQEYSDEEVDA